MCKQTTPKHIHNHIYIRSDRNLYRCDTFGWTQPIIIHPYSRAPPSYFSPYIHFFLYTKRKGIIISATWSPLAWPPPQLLLTGRSLSNQKQKHKHGSSKLIRLIRCLTFTSRNLSLTNTKNVVYTWRSAPEMLIWCGCFLIDIYF